MASSTLSEQGIKGCYITPAFRDVSPKKVLANAMKVFGDSEGKYIARVITKASMEYNSMGVVVMADYEGNLYNTYFRADGPHLIYFAPTQGVVTDAGYKWKTSSSSVICLDLSRVPEDKHFDEISRHFYFAATLPTLECGPTTFAHDLCIPTNALYTVLEFMRDAKIPPRFM